MSMTYLKVLVFVGFCAAVVGCGDSKTQAPPSLKQEPPKAPGATGGAGEKGMKTNKES